MARRIAVAAGMAKCFWSHGEQKRVVRQARVLRIVHGWMPELARRDAGRRNCSNPQGHELHPNRAGGDARWEQCAVLQRNRRGADTTRCYARRADHLDVLSEDRKPHPRL